MMCPKWRHSHHVFCQCHAVHSSYSAELLPWSLASCYITNIIDLRISSTSVAILNHEWARYRFQAINEYVLYLLQEACNKTIHTSVLKFGTFQQNWVLKLGKFQQNVNKNLPRAHLSNGIFTHIPANKWVYEQEGGERGAGTELMTDAIHML